MDITILGIESSCDDTSAAVLRNNVLLSNVIASQAVHVKYGGGIPELASRAHQQNIIPVVDTALKEAGGAADRIDDHRANRHFVGAKGFFGLFQGHFHIIFRIHLYFSFFSFIIGTNLSRKH